MATPPKPVRTIARMAIDIMHDSGTGQYGAAFHESLFPPVWAHSVIDAVSILCQGEKAVADAMYAGLKKKRGGARKAKAAKK